MTPSIQLVVQVGGRSGVEGPGLSQWQRGLWGLGTVFMQYAWTRLDQVAASQHWGDVDSTPAVQRAWTVLRSCETAFSVASLLNFLVFLRHGKYRQACTGQACFPFDICGVNLSLANPIMLCTVLHLMLQHNAVGY